MLACEHVVNTWQQSWFNHAQPLAHISIHICIYDRVGVTDLVEEPVFLGDFYVARTHVYFLARTVGMQYTCVYYYLYLSLISRTSKTLYI